MYMIQTIFLFHILGGIIGYDNKDIIITTHANSTAYIIEPLFYDWSYV